jgi:hypothetical protein
MKPPKCRLCGHAHRNNEPHVFDEPARNHDVTKPATNKVTCNQCAAKDAEIAVLRAQVSRMVNERVTPPQHAVKVASAKRDRAKYMREYRKAKRSGFIGIAYG